MLNGAAHARGRAWSSAWRRISPLHIPARIRLKPQEQDQRVSTACWWLGERFRRRYPTTRLALDQMVMMGGRVWCAGAATATFILMRKVIEHYSGPDIAGLVARFMLIDPGHVSQVPYMLHDFRPVAADPVVARAQKWAGSSLSEPFSLDAMANAAAVSSRTLIHHFRYSIGLTPLTYIQKAVSKKPSRCSLPAISRRRILSIALAMPT